MQMATHRSVHLIEDIEMSPAGRPFQLMIGNLSGSANYEMIIDLFKQYGPIKSCVVDYAASGQPLG
jgi:RNA recognition motif-containing protein